MDKSEGTDFISKMLSSVGGAVSKWYHIRQKSIALVSLKRARSEKVNMLGNKVLEIIKEKQALTTSALKEEYDAIVRMDRQIAASVEEIEKMKRVSTAEGANEKKEGENNAQKLPAEKTDNGQKEVGAVTEKDRTKKASLKSAATSKTGATKTTKSKSKKITSVAAGAVDFSDTKKTE